MPRTSIALSYTAALVAFVCCSNVTAQDWQPTSGAMMTRWGGELTPENAWTEYPRPQLKRAEWTNLNGLWQYAIRPVAETATPTAWDGSILVPFAVEAPLSGVGKRITADDALWYQRSFKLDEPVGGRLLLHFEAVDYRCEVFINGTSVGEHVGGNLPFTFDVTDAVKLGENDLHVRVEDATDTPGRYQIRGKQKFDNKGIFYTPVSGIHQSVWLEEVPSTSIDSVHTVTQVDGTVTLAIATRGEAANLISKVSVSLDGKAVATGVGSANRVTLQIERPRLWSPTSPTLYDATIDLVGNNGSIVDRITTYFGIREVGKRRDEEGNLRLTLNGEPIFHWGPLDQGWWPDGLLTPPSDDAMTFEIEYLRRAGFNMIRKHIKVEPRRYYYHCDRLGMMVWQDQVSGGANEGTGEWPKWQRLGKTHPAKNRPSAANAGDPLDAEWPDFAHEQYMTELKGMVDHLRAHPSIVCWVPFNERWGQHRSMKVGEWIVDYDPTRLINIASGGNFFPVGDMADEHAYPNPFFETDNPKFDDFVKIVGEFGGHGWPVKDHLWDKKKRNWGYGGLPKTKDEWFQRFDESMRILGDLKRKGVAGAVYTQTTDVEGEINGLLTYDREVIKMPGPRLHRMAQTHGIIDAPRNAAASTKPNKRKAAKPNIVVILVDDMGYSDIGCYGGEIDTPNLNELAAEGLRFTQFYNSGRCCPTRASLMTGLHPHQAGIGHMTMPPGKDLGIKGPYQGYLNNRCTTLAEVLHSAGYHTLMTGKWHLGANSQSTWPLQRGFDRYFGGLSGAFNYFKPGSDRGLTRDNTSVEPDENFYATDTFTDVACEYISKATETDDRPFFLYLAYNAPHWPLNPKVADFERYRGKYTGGWEQLMRDRFRRQKELGLFPDSTAMAPHVGPAWDSLTDEQRDNLDARMAAYAGCIDSIDQNVGKLVAHLEAIGERDNTVIMFLSDNGACQEGGKFGSGTEEVIRNPPLETTAGPRLGLCWANACNTPFRKYKHYVHEGGACTPFIVNWPAGISEPGGFVRHHAYLPDIMATCVELSGGQLPAGKPAIAGRSMLPLWNGQDQPIHTKPIYWEHEGNAAIRWGDHKLVREYQKPWELYDISEDRTEQRDLAGKFPSRARQMQALWESWAIAHKVRFPRRFDMYQELRRQAEKASK